MTLNLLDVEIGALEKLHKSNKIKLARLEKISNYAIDLIQVHVDFAALLDRYPGETRSGAEFKKEFDALHERDKDARVRQSMSDKNPKIHDDIITLRIDNDNIAARINHRRYYETRNPA